MQDALRDATCARGWRSGHVPTRRSPPTHQARHTARELPASRSHRDVGALLLGWLPWRPLKSVGGHHPRGLARQSQDGFAGRLRCWGACLRIRRDQPGTRQRHPNLREQLEVELLWVARDDVVVTQRADQGPVSFERGSPQYERTASRAAWLVVRESTPASAVTNGRPVARTKEQ